VSARKTARYWWESNHGWTQMNAEANTRRRRKGSGRSGYQASAVGRFGFPPESLRPEATYARGSMRQGAQTV
jgi:hypothetical protein